MTAPSNTRPARPRRPRRVAGPVAAVLAAAALAAAFACSSFSGEAPSTLDGGADGDPDSASSADGTGGDASADADPDAGCPMPVDCTKLDASHCDTFDIDPVAYWSMFVKAPAVENGACGRIITAQVDPTDAGQEQIQMFGRALGKPPEIMHVSFDLYLDVTLPDFKSTGYLTVFELQRGATGSVDGYFNVYVDSTGANVGVRANANPSIRLEVVPRQWNHVDVVIDFAKDGAGRIITSADGRMNTFMGATLAPDAGSPTSAAMILGLRGRGPAPAAAVRIDNFVLY